MNTSVSDVKYDFIILENFKPLRMAALFNLIPKQLMQCFVKLLELKPKAILTSTFLNLFYFILIFYSFFFFFYIKLTVVVCKNCVFVQKHMDLTVYIVQS